ncbi:MULTISPECIES: DUF2510 domain-containing protein [Actinomycetes]|uniref:DUF2510 domain-containing protein n=1 Tax=Actinomycetes TaxID=1760 RepID=UPI0036DBDFCD
MKNDQGVKIANAAISVAALLILLLLATGLDWGGAGLFFILLSFSVTGGVITWVVFAIRALVVKPAPLPSQRRAPGVLMPAGWYPDQQDPSQVRWFNGSEWTAATLPRQ